MTQIATLMDEVPQILFRRFQSVTETFRQHRRALMDQIRQLISGQRKNEDCDWWLTYIEQEVGKHLREHGAQPNNEFLPRNYTEVPPADLNVVRAQCQIIGEILDGECDDEFYSFVEMTSQSVYAKKVDGLMRDMEFVLNGKWREFVVSNGNETNNGNNRNIGNGWDDDDVMMMTLMSQQEEDKMRADYEYLKQMKRMDEEIFEERKKGKKMDKKKVVMSSVVPVAGLVVARFHIMQCELTTVLDLWPGMIGRINNPQ